MIARKRVRSALVIAAIGVLLVACSSGKKDHQLGYRDRRRARRDVAIRRR